jgi:hypothetical protein
MDIDLGFKSFIELNTKRYQRFKYLNTANESIIQYFQCLTLNIINNNNNNNYGVSHQLNTYQKPLAIIIFLTQSYICILTKM